MSWSSLFSTRLSTNIQKKGLGLPGPGRAYCRSRWNWNRYQPGGGEGAGLVVAGCCSGASGQGPKETVA